MEIKSKIKIVTSEPQERAVIFEVKLDSKDAEDHGSGLFLPNDFYPVLSSKIRNQEFAPIAIHNFNDEYALKYRLWTRINRFKYSKVAYVKDNPSILVKVFLMGSSKVMFTLGFNYMDMKGGILSRGSHAIAIQEVNDNGEFITLTNLRNIVSGNLKFFLFGV